MVINNYIPAAPGPALTNPNISGSQSVTCASSRLSSLSIPGFREDAVEAYCEWHCSKVRREEQKQQYQLARDLTLDRGFDLELVYQDNDSQFYIERGVLEGVARRFVRDVNTFLDQYNAS